MTELTEEQKERARTIAREFIRILTATQNQPEGSLPYLKYAVETYLHLSSKKDKSND